MSSLNWVFFPFLLGQTKPTYLSASVFVLMENRINLIVFCSCVANYLCFVIHSKLC